MYVCISNYCSSWFLDPPRLLLLFLCVISTYPVQGQVGYTVDEMRLAGGTTPNEGRLEVRLQDSNVWHTVCSDTFHDFTTKLICSELGWPFSIPCSHNTAPMTDLPVLHMGQILNMTAVCLIDGSVTTLSGCMNVEYRDAPDTCNHDNDVWIRCLRDAADFEVRLVDSYFPGDGFVQTRCPNDNWTTVCDNDWDERDAEVVCRQLGLSWSYGTDSVGTLETNLGDVVINNVFCNGNETVFGDCSLKNVSPDCPSFRGPDPGVQCGEYYELNDVTISLCGCHHCGHPLATNPFNNPQQCCKCDCACIKIGDCCADFDVSVHCPIYNTADLTLNDIDLFYYECIGVPGSQRYNYGYVLISKCPASWEGINTRLNCEVSRNLTDVVGLLPVFNSNKVYKNVFCAVCHGESIDDVIFWQVHEERNKWASPFAEPTGYVVRSPGGAGFTDGRPRSCPYDVLDSCATEIGDAKLVTACQSYFAPVLFTGHPKLFKNPHCAVCNGVTDDLLTQYCLQCPKKMCSGIAGDIPCSPAACRTLDEFVTVEALFNFNDLQTNEFGKAESISCADETVYDPFLKMCRSLSCPPDFVLISETCEPLRPPVPVINETEIIGTKEAIHSFNCILDSIAISLTEVGAIQVITKEIRQETMICKALDIGCVNTEMHTISLAFLFQNGIQILNFTEAVQSVLINITSDSTDMLPVCNVTGVSTYISYSDKLALPPQCESFIANSTKVFGSDFNSNVVLFAQYDFNQTTDNYTTLLSPDVCHIRTNLECSPVLTLNQSEFELTNMPHEMAILLTSNITIARDEYLLLSDGRIQICSSTIFSANPTRSIKDIIAAVCSSLSVVALLATLITYLVFSVLRNIGGKAVMNLTVALMFSYLSLLLSGAFLFSNAACTAVAILIHYLWLSAFTWMMLFGFNIAKTFSRRGVSSPRAGGSSFWMYTLFGWITPGIIVAVCISLHFCQCTSFVFQYGSVEERTCFLVGSRAVIFAFVTPISALLLLSISFFIFMAIHLRQQRNASKLARTGGAAEELYTEVVIYLRLCSVIGATWVFAYLYILLPNAIVVSYIYSILNSLQGVFIFLAFACTSRVRTMWKNQIGEMTTRTTGTSGKSEPTNTESKGFIKPASQTADTHV